MQAATPLHLMGFPRVPAPPPFAKLPFPLVAAAAMVPSMEYGSAGLPPTLPLETGNGVLSSSEVELAACWIIYT